GDDDGDEWDAWRHGPWQASECLDDAAHRSGERDRRGGCEYPGGEAVEGGDEPGAEPHPGRNDDEAEHHGVDGVQSQVGHAPTMLLATRRFPFGPPPSGDASHLARR